MVLVMICAPEFSASRRPAEPSSSRMRTTTPRLCSTASMVSVSCASRFRRSVSITTVSKTGSSFSSCSDCRWCASHAIEFDLPLPAECWIR